MSQSETPVVFGPVDPEQIASKNSDYALEDKNNSEHLGVPASCPSEYMDVNLRKFVTLTGNGVYQKEPSTTVNTVVTAPLTGHPVSAATIKARAEALENQVYAPTVIDGQLYFVSLDNDIRTAHESSSNFSQKNSQASGSSAKTPPVDPELTFTYQQLSTVLGTQTLKNLVNKFNTAVAGGQAPQLSNLQPAPAGQQDEQLKKAVQQMSLTNVRLQTALDSLHTAKSGAFSITGSSATTTSGTSLNEEAHETTANTARSPNALSARETSANTARSFASQIHPTAVSRTMVTGELMSSAPNTAMSRTMVTGSELSSAPNTACSRTMVTGSEKSTSAITACSQLSTRSANTAVSRTMVTASEKSNSAITGMSRTMVTASETSTAPNTAFSRTMVTGSELSSAPNTARSRTMVTGSELSSSAITARSADSTHTAVSRTMVTASEKSNSAMTARSNRTTANTAASRTIVTASEKSTSAMTGLGTDADLRTAVSNMSDKELVTAWERLSSDQKSVDTARSTGTALDASDVRSALSSMSNADLRTAIESTSSLGVDPHTLVITPESDPRAAFAQPSVVNCSR